MYLSAAMSQADGADLTVYQENMQTQIKTSGK